MPCHQHRTRHVDAYHARLNLSREYARRAAVGCEERYAVPQFVRVDERYRTRQIRHAAAMTNIQHGTTIGKLNGVVPATTPSG